MQIIPQITYISVLTPIKSIKKRNAAFHQLDDQFKRLEIAWDALQLIVNGYISRHSYSYWDNKLFSLEDASSSAELFQKNLLNDDKIMGCKVCQRGLLMLSTIRMGNRIKPGTNETSCGSYKNIQGFSMTSMEKQENYYEGFSSAEYKNQHPYRYGTLEMKANILCNILVNGDFNEKDFTDYLKVD